MDVDQTVGVQERKDVTLSPMDDAKEMKLFYGVTRTICRTNKVNVAASMLYFKFLRPGCGG